MRSRGPYLNLIVLMIKHGMTIKDIATITNKSYPTANYKIRKKARDTGKENIFNIDECRAIANYFREVLHEDVTIDYLFEVHEERKIS